jgi:hypothetical protein
LTVPKHPLILAETISGVFQLPDDGVPVKHPPFLALTISGLYQLPDSYGTGPYPVVTLDTITGANFGQLRTTMDGAPVLTATLSANDQDVAGTYTLRARGALVGGAGVPDDDLLLKWAGQTLGVAESSELVLASSSDVVSTTLQLGLTPPATDATSSTGVVIFDLYTDGVLTQENAASLVVSFTSAVSGVFDSPAPAYIWENLVLVQGYSAAVAAGYSQDSTLSVQNLQGCTFTGTFTPQPAPTTGDITQSRYLTGFSVSYTFTACPQHFTYAGLNYPGLGGFIVDGAAAFVAGGVLNSVTPHRVVSLVTTGAHLTHTFSSADPTIEDAGLIARPYRAFRIVATPGQVLTAVNTLGADVVMEVLSPYAIVTESPASTWTLTDGGEYLIRYMQTTGMPVYEAYDSTLTLT